MLSHVIRAKAVAAKTPKTPRPTTEAFLLEAPRQATACGGFARSEAMRYVALATSFATLVLGLQEAEGNDPRELRARDDGPFNRFRAPNWDPETCEGTWNASTPVCFLHISKAGGNSLIVDARDHFESFSPTRPHGIERCAPPEFVLMPSCCHAVLLRSPREHVWSQYRECLLSPWGRKTTTKDFPRGQAGEGWTDGFEAWLDVFQAPPTPSSFPGHARLTILLVSGRSGHRRRRGEGP